MRKFLSILILTAAFSCFGLFAVLLGLRSFGLEGLVSQVFKHSEKIHLMGRQYVHTYNVAVTPTNRMAVTCDLVTLTSEMGLNLLEKKVYLWPTETPQYAYYETAESKIAMGLSLVMGVFLLWVSVVLFFKEN